MNHSDKDDSVPSTSNRPGHARRDRACPGRTEPAQGRMAGADRIHRANRPLVRRPPEGNRLLVRCGLRHPWPRPGNLQTGPPGCHRPLPPRRSRSCRRLRQPGDRASGAVRLRAPGRAPRRRDPVGFLARRMPPRRGGAAGSHFRHLPGRDRQASGRRGGPAGTGALRDRHGHGGHRSLGSRHRDRRAHVVAPRVRSPRGWRYRLSPGRLPQTPASRRPGAGRAAP